MTIYKVFLVADKMLLRPADKIKLVHKGSSKKNNNDEISFKHKKKQFRKQLKDLRMHASLDMFL